MADWESGSDSDVEVVEDTRFSPEMAWIAPYWSNFQAFLEANPGFIEAAAEAFRRATAGTTTGAVVREFPQTAEAATQATPPPPLRTEASAQTAPDRFADERGYRVKADAATQTGVERTTTANDGCWNCGDPAHNYAACPKPATKYCFRCGRKGVTVATCPQDGAPYRREQGRSAETPRTRASRRWGPEDEARVRRIIAETRLEREHWEEEYRRRTRYDENVEFSPRRGA